MTPNATDGACESFLDEIAAVVDGDEDAVARHLDHLASCDDCRDARHEATEALREIGAAGDDFAAPADMAERVLRAIDEAAAATPAAFTPAAATLAPSGATGSAPATITAPPPAHVPSASMRSAAPRPLSFAPTGTGAAAARRSRRAWLVAGSLAAAATAAIVGVARLGDRTGDRAGNGLDSSSPDTASAGSRAGAPWTGTIAVVDRASSGARSGVELRPAGADRFAPAAAGAAIPAGAAIRTDESTRVELALGDGSRVYLDHATEIALGRDGRAVVMARGNLVAEVAHLEGSPRALFRTPGARVQVLGTRFSLAATDQQTSVRVVRGAVQLASDRGTVDVRAGEEGVAGADAAPEVTAAGDVVGAVGWSELLTPGEPDDELPAGIGELRAFRPGESRDRDWKLALARHRVTVRIAGNVARTEIEETFQNDSANPLEGVYRFPLPPDARVERLALDVNGVMEEGAFVARDRAARIWRGVIQKATPRRIAPREEIIWVPGPWRDPALLEWQRGGRFELRIFPIPKRGSRTVQLAYTQILEPEGSERRYVYPLPHRAGAPAAGQFDIDVRLSGIDAAREPRVHNYEPARAREGAGYHLSLSAARFEPRGDFAVEFALPDSGAELRAWSFAGAGAAAPTLAASRRGGADPAVVAAQREIAADGRATALIALRPRLPRWTESRERDLVLVVDASQSMVGERFARARKLVAALVAGMDRRDRFAVLACDADCRAFAPRPQPPSASATRRLADWLAQEHPAGASDLVAALERGADLAGAARTDGREAWVLYIGDGSATTGYRRLADLRGETEALAARARVSISTVGIGGDADTSALTAIARAGAGFFTPYVPGQRAELAALSILETTSGVALVNPVVQLPDGLEDASPAELPTLRSGQELRVAARMRGPVRGDVVLRGTVGGKPYENRFPLALDQSAARGNAFVPRVWAALTIERLELEGRGDDQARIVALSQAYGVLSRHTSLLVLESPAMFRAFGVDRSRPAVEWTGGEAAEVTESAGAVDYNESAGPRDHLARAQHLPSGSAGRSDPWDDGDAAAAGVEGGADAKAPAAPAAKKPEPEEAPRVEKAPTQIVRPGGRRWIPMRREWFRVGSIADFDGVSPAIATAVARADAALQLEPDSRERTRALVQALSFAGELDRAVAVASRWLERDRMDAEALATLADLLGRQGRRAESVRLLSGVVDLQPDQRPLHLRLAAAYERIGAADRACSHRIALAALAPADAGALAEALRCQRATGRQAGADRLLRAIADPTVRGAVETRAALPGPAARAGGDLALDASWTGAADLDLSLVAPDGTRISWMGGRAGLAAEAASATGREALRLRRIPAGRYLVEIARIDPADRTPVRGAVAVRVLGVRRSMPFALADARAVIGRVNVTRRSRLVPVDSMTPSR